jgi:hypothetical protein
MISNDVNVIFAFLDIKNRSHSKSMLFVGKNARRQYILLANVMKSFVKTYKDYVKDVGAAIEFQVIKCKEEMKKSPLKNPPASHVTRLVDSGINSDLQELCKKYYWLQFQRPTRTCKTLLQAKQWKTE